MRRLIVLLTSLLTTPALASEDDAKLARTAWSAWQCHQFAFHAKGAAESERFFNLGLNAARTFVTKLHAGQITRDETFKHAPIAVMFVAQGPSVDFVVGSAVAQDTFDSMAKKDSSGAAMPSEKWITDTSLLVYRREQIPGRELRFDQVVRLAPCDTVASHGWPGAR